MRAAVNKYSTAPKRTAASVNACDCMHYNIFDILPICSTAGNKTSLSWNLRALAMTGMLKYLHYVIVRSRGKTLGNSMYNIQDV